MKTSLLAFFLLCVSVHAADLLVTVTEIKGTEWKRAPAIVTAYRTNPTSLHSIGTKSAAGHALPGIHKYSIANWKLRAAGGPLIDATEILFQTTVNGADFVVLRDEYNSWFGPLDLLLFLASHPVQVSKIVIVKVVSGRLVARKELLRKDASYHWRATISK